MGNTKVNEEALEFPGPGLEPDYGRRLLVNVVDERASNEPDRAFVHIPVSNDPKDGWKPVTYRQVSNAVNHVAHELVQRAKDQGAPTDDFPTIAYIGPSDVRYPIFMLACIKAHHKAFFISPRNSTEGQISLFKAINCSMLYFAESYLQTVLPWLERHPMRIVMAPDPETWLASTASPMAFTKLFDEARWDPLVVLHTSGSTGMPKPIVMRQGSLAIADDLRNGPDLHGEPSAWSYWGTASKFFLPMPLFHAAGTAAVASLGIYYGAAMVLGITARPLTPDMAVESLKYSNADAAMLPPSVIEELSHMDEGVEALAALKFIGFGGGNLAAAAGHSLVQRGVSLSNLIASTECLPYAVHYQSDPRLWQYFIINTKDMGAEFEPMPWDAEVFELIFRRDELGEPGRKAAFYTFPDKTEWATGDLFKPHPTLPDHWRYYGRADNIMVFSNGEKLNPVTIEETMLGHPRIKGALVVGDQKFQPALILEPHIVPADKGEADALIEEVWPLVEQANKETVTHGRIARELVVLSDPARPFSRAAKGSIQRNQTVREYSDFIEELYRKMDERVALSAGVEIDLSSKELLCQSIVKVIHDRIGNVRVGPDTDLFAAGMDSLQVINLSKILRWGLEAAGLAVDQNTVAPRVVYANPTPRALADRLFLVAHDEDIGQSESSRDIEALADMILKYTADLPAPRGDQADPLDQDQTVLITGTTGSLGAYMLDRLISSDNVKKVIALNRGEDGGRSRQPAFNSERGLTTDFSEVDFLGVDLSVPTWGLEQSEYDRLLASADRIMHNAWPVNFVISVASFEPFIRGVRHLVDFANSAAKRVPIVFISSIGTADGWTSSDPVPERQLSDLTLPHMGYGRSKLAGSLILDAAAERSGVPAATVRVGQIGGPRGKMGMWNRQEFIPSLISSSVYLGVLPDSVGPIDVVDWTPVEDIAGLILDVAGVTAPMPVSDISGYFHGVNPSATTWTEVAKVLQEFYGGRVEKIVPLEEWLAKLEASASDANANADKNPAIKLLDTYRGMVDANRAGLGHVYFDMRRTVEKSPTMRGSGPIDEGLVRNWCEQWKF
ncbi:putative NRPS-like protein biosynthetic cluster [Purpureocillium takamizusanense]|uniref:NRPS-like protein biosynthetic cluster n=1 Tax=Purpureocillium takamizusanense TaxID=2060973 RepID=A0A9Q8VC15_9HYPO|nr:putative NRPS-like protein biosynthetic cluster [Purpureocillium takamizusanense]UNI19521.1 putative NRPS-like protein biosynthetic cluster [Purpureocillium takamizusanense]